MLGICGVNKFDGDFLYLMKYDREIFWIGNEIEVSHVSIISPTK